MQVYERFKLANFANLQVDVSALYLIAAPSTPEPVEREVIERAKRGEPMTFSLDFRFPIWEHTFGRE
jgi:hypothetical protein